MTKYILRRLLQAIPTFFGITILCYGIIVLAPGDPATLMTFDPTLSPERRESLERTLGINDPLPLQYLRWLIGDDWMVVDNLRWYQVTATDAEGQISTGWLSELMVFSPSGSDLATAADLEIRASRQPLRDAPDGSAEVIDRVTNRETLEVIGTQVETVWGDNYGILRGDFGVSFTHKVSPWTLIGERLGASIELNIAVLAVSMSIGIFIGILAAVWRGGLFDNFTRVVAVIGDSVPAFWLSFLLILAFAAPGLDWFPMGGRCDPGIRGGCPPIYQRLEYLVLPTIVLALGGIAGWSRYIRAAMLETINSDYIRTARSKGLRARMVWFKHAFRNALVPIATFLGPTFFSLLGGATIIELIFAWPGVGRVYLQSLTAYDYPVIMAGIVLGAILTIMGYILSDILYALFDPRIRF